MRKTPAAVLAGALLTSGLLGVASGPADASSAKRAPAASHRTAAASSPAAAKQVRQYWTKDRMRSATPKVVHAKPSSTTVKAGKPVVVKGKPGSGSTDGYLGGPWTKGGNVVKTTGKVFFTEGSTNYVCSGSSISSANGSTVTTAGHCVNEGPGAFVTNFVFVPAYDHGAAPYGKFAATQLFTTNEWRTAGDFNYDVGMAKVGTVAGKTLAATVGSQGIGFNTSRPVFAYSFGYPQASPYDGTTLDYCSGTTSNDTAGGTNDYRLACNMTGGSSGGPWFRDFNGSTGTQISVNSFGYRGEKNAMYGPYFGSVIQSLYTTAQSS
jgi:hypothetical protein